MAGWWTAWSESRPDEGGRVQLVVRTPTGETVDVLPEGWSARTRVHEYGGGAWTIAATGGDDADSVRVWFASWEDQRVWRIDVSAGGAGAPVAVTSEPTSRHGLRYADLVVHGDLLVCVRESHEPDAVAAHGGAVNELVAVPAAGGEPIVLRTGPDFVAAPRVSPDGARLAWYEWDHPSMPWDATRLLVAALDSTALGGAGLGEPTQVAGGPEESAIEPRWSPEGTLHFVTDRSDWWNVWRWTSEAGATPVTDFAGEVGTPPWVFAMSRYAFLPDGAIACAVAAGGLDRLHVVAADGTARDLGLPDTELASVVARGAEVVAIGAGFGHEPEVIAVDPATGQRRVLRPARDLGIDPSWWSTAEPVSFPSGADGERTAHALHYPPRNPEVGAAHGPPPLIVLIHGGPTAMARARLDPAKQYWTSRGFALLDVNYGGSTGFGRRYRQLLAGQWGIVDVEDCLAAASWAATSGSADPARLFIRGGSAGGFTVLAALVGADVFAGGSSSYGVADLTALAEETHKFESRYLDGLVGPYPEARDVYEARSPIHHVDDITAPLIVFQGLEDEIVPPNQSEAIVDALRARGVPVEYHPFEGEQHGFRRAETVVAVLEAELAFLSGIGS